MRQLPQANGDKDVPNREGWCKELLDAIKAIQAQLQARVDGPRRLGTVGRDQLVISDPVP